MYFIGKADDSPVFVGDQYRQISVVHNTMVSGFLLCYTPGDHSLSNMVVHATHSQGMQHISHMTCTNLGYNQRR